VVQTTAEIRLPEWVGEVVAPPAPASDEACMSLAIALARENVARRNGGPFGAVIRADDTGAIISVGVNRAVASGNPVLHAETVAISLAAERLSGPGGRTLFTSCEPCIMCLGASHWSGVNRIVSAAAREDAQAAGFSEGAGVTELRAEMAARGVVFQDRFMRDEAAAVLRSYLESGGPIYGPKR
jgi:tRNA(Arg) A34 adenosine deaminase TadA